MMVSRNYFGMSYPGIETYFKRAFWIGLHVIPTPWRSSHSVWIYIYGKIKTIIYLICQRSQRRFPFRRRCAGATRFYKRGTTKEEEEVSNSIMLNPANGRLLRCFFTAWLFSINSYNLVVEGDGTRSVQILEFSQHYTCPAPRHSGLWLGGFSDFLPCIKCGSYWSFALNPR